VVDVVDGGGVAPPDPEPGLTAGGGDWHCSGSMVPGGQSFGAFGTDSHCPESVAPGAQF
jgi:hypothetical protein